MSKYVSFLFLFTCFVRDVWLMKKKVFTRCPLHTFADLSMPFFSFFSPSFFLSERCVCVYVFVFCGCPLRCCDPQRTQDYMHNSSNTINVLLNNRVAADGEQCKCSTSIWSLIFRFVFCFSFCCFWIFVCAFDKIFAGDQCVVVVYNVYINRVSSRSIFVRMADANNGRQRFYFPLVKTFNHVVVSVSFDWNRISTSDRRKKVMGWTRGRDKERQKRFMLHQFGGMARWC